MKMINSHVSNHRLIVILSFLFLNPLPRIHGAPAKTRHREQSSWNIDQPYEYLQFPAGIVQFQGFFGCKYDPTVCNDKESCLDDHLFGQCWHDEQAIPMALTLQNGQDRFLERKLPALTYTLDFLAHFRLTWHDYVTQCILSRILTDQHPALDRSRLATFYWNCFNQVEYTVQRPTRQRSRHQSLKLDDDGIPYSSLAETSDPNFDLDGTFGIPLLMQENRHRHSPHRSSVGYHGNTRPVKSRKLHHLLSNGQFSHSNLLKSDLDQPREVVEGTQKINLDTLTKLQMEDQPRLSLAETEETMVRNLMNNLERFLATAAVRGYIQIDRDFEDKEEGNELLRLIAKINAWPMAMFTEVDVEKKTMTYCVKDEAGRINASDVASAVLNHQKLIEHQLDLRIIDIGIGNPAWGTQLSVERYNGSRLTLNILITSTLIFFLIIVFGIFCFIHRHDRIRHRLAEMTHWKSASTDSYRELCSEPTEEVSSELPSTKAAPRAPASASAYVKRPSENSSSSSSSPRGSTSVWTEETPAPVNMDIMTGHLILSFMEDHLRDRHRLAAEWQGLCADEISEDPAASYSIALSETNIRKNRSTDCVPYDHVRIQLGNNDEDGSGDDYINASPISDADPKCKYIATQGPMPNTTNAFWQMVWEQGSCVIVALARPIENGQTMCHHYWPVEGSERFDDFEVNLVSEHIWSEDYLVRSFYLKNIETTETRTVTQFHFLTWEEFSNPPSMKTFLDFRRKVNKCFRGRSSPIIVHCNDGIGRTGTFILLDMVLNGIYKGVREISIAATLEHMRDQRPQMVKTKEQFEFVFVAVAEEVNYLLSAISQ